MPGHKAGMTMIDDRTIFFMSLPSSVDVAYNSDVRRTEGLGAAQCS